MKNTQLNTVEAGNILALTSDQISTLVDLVSDLIQGERVHLKASPFEYAQNIHIRALTHYRGLRRALKSKEIQLLKEESRRDKMEMEEDYRYFQRVN